MGSSQIRDQTCVPILPDGFLTTGPPGASWDTAFFSAPGWRRYCRRIPTHSALDYVSSNWWFFSRKYLFLFIYLAALGLIFSTLDLWSSLRHAGSLVEAFEPLVEACGNLVSWPGIEPKLLHWECWAWEHLVAIGSTGKSHKEWFWNSKYTRPFHVLKFHSRWIFWRKGSFIWSCKIKVYLTTGRCLMEKALQNLL